VAYTRDHFSAEEEMMARAAYPGLAEHQTRHRDLTSKVERYVARFERGEIALNAHLLHFLRDWLTNHIQKEDLAYSPCMLARHPVTALGSPRQGCGLRLSPLERQLG